MHLMIDRTEKLWNVRVCESKNSSLIFWCKSKWECQLIAILFIFFCLFLFSWLAIYRCCLFTYLSNCFYERLSPSAYKHLSFYLPVRLFMYQSIYLPVCHSVYYQTSCLFIRHSLWPLSNLPVCLSISLSICLPLSLPRFHSLPLHFSFSQGKNSH